MFHNCGAINLQYQYQYQYHKASEKKNYDVASSQFPESRPKISIFRLEKLTPKPVTKCKPKSWIAKWLARSSLLVWASFARTSASSRKWWIIFSREPTLTCKESGFWKGVVFSTPAGKWLGIEWVHLWHVSPFSGRCRDRYVWSWCPPGRPAKRGTWEIGQQGNCLAWWHTFDWRWHHEEHSELSMVGLERWAPLHVSKHFLACKSELQVLQHFAAKHVHRLRHTKHCESMKLLVLPDSSCVQNAKRPLSNGRHASPKKIQERDILILL